jgi:two-component system sensor histidine kinase MprB
VSLRLRVALALAVATAFASVGVGIISYRLTEGRLYEAVDDSLVEATQVVLSRRIDERFPERGPFDGLDFQVTRSDGKVLQSTFPRELRVSKDLLGLRAGRTALADVELGRDRYRVLVVGLDGGLVQVGRDLRETERVLDALRQRTIALVAGVTTLAALAGALIAGRVTRPLRRLTEAAVTVEETGSLDVDLPTTRDRDEVGQLSDAFRRMIAALSRSRYDQARLVQDAGHELRTPLTSIRTNLDMLDRYGELDPSDRREMVLSMRTEVDELTALVNEIVQAASGETDGVEPERVDLGPVVGAVAERVARRTEREIRVVADGSVAEVRTDALRRAVSNLLDNAVKFDTDGGSIEVRIADGVITVADRGPGIPEHERSRVFDRFHRTEAARSLPGSGLGLAIVAEVARVNGGAVSITDRPGGGAEVSLRLRPAVEVRDLTGDGLT